MHGELKVLGGVISERTVSRIMRSACDDHLRRRTGKRPFTITESGAEVGIHKKLGINPSGLGNLQGSLCEP
jgi:hypothetical protein